MDKGMTYRPLIPSMDWPHFVAPFGKTSVRYLKRYGLKTHKSKKGNRLKRLKRRAHFAPPFIAAIASARLNAESLVSSYQSGSTTLGFCS